MEKSLSYKDSGVDIEAGNAFVGDIAPLASATFAKGVMQGLGGFGGMFDLAKHGFNDPILVSGTDGVGTKLLLAIAIGKHDTIGIDLVAMCVNDILAQGAKPLFFLDYFATGKLDRAIGTQVVAGIAEGCRQAGCALIGGETAEMPDMYAAGHYDLAGFTVGAVERANLLPVQSDMKAGDTLIGLASSGVHANGFSLVRKIVDRAGLGWDDNAPFKTDQTLGENFLTPTRIYVQSLSPLIVQGLVKGFAHITGGGLVENVPRVLPDNLRAEIDWAAWAEPEMFAWLHEEGNVTKGDMRRTFNMGVGGVLVVDKTKVQAVLGALTVTGEQAWVMGELTQNG